MDGPGEEGAGCTSPGATRRSVVVSLVVALAVPFWSSAPAALAQAFPSRPITFVIPFAAGGGSDVMARIIAEPLSQRLGQPVLVDNKPGGGATIGADFVAKSQPDGYTWLHTSPGPQIINPYLMAKLPYDPQKDLLPVVRLGTFTSVLVVHPSVPAKTVKELIDYAKANPRKLNFASAGIGSGSHLASEYFKTVAGIDIVHVPYKGTGNALQDLVAGNVQMTIDSMAALLPSIKAGSLRALAVTTLERSPNLPDVPTLADTLAGFDASPMNYLSVRGGTPREVVDKINREVNAVLAMPAVKERLAAIGVLVTPSTPDEIAAQVKSEQAKWKKVIEVSGAKAE
jgi:tripartite-type tricarboxylate transporter receptor subunit TctC